LAPFCTYICHSVNLFLADFPKGGFTGYLATHANWCFDNIYILCNGQHQLLWAIADNTKHQARWWCCTVSEWFRHRASGLLHNIYIFLKDQAAGAPTPVSEWFRHCASGLLCNIYILSKHQACSCCYTVSEWFRHREPGLLHNIYILSKHQAGSCCYTGLEWFRQRASGLLHNIWPTKSSDWYATFVSLGRPISVYIPHIRSTLCRHLYQLFL
jgi:hypothetical protein